MTRTRRNATDLAIIVLLLTLAAGALSIHHLDDTDVRPAQHGPITPAPAPTVTVTETVRSASAAVTPAPTPSPAPTTVWDRLAQCESDGTWDEGDGGIEPHRGGLQWRRTTWLAVKPPGAPDDPADATREQEIAAAERLMDEPWGGFEHWPTCARRLGLTD